MITSEQLQQHAAWCRDGSGKRIDANGADLRRANLRRSNLRGADLRCANLRGADLQGADLRCANLRGADLQGADLGCADLGCADLRCAYLQGADLQGADLRDANLQGAIGNMREIKSAHFDQWPVTWSADVLAIGCQQHAIEKWRNADPRWIAALTCEDSDWWSRYGALVLQLIDASPATGVVLEARP